MSFKRTIGMLSKASAQAVTTPRTKHDDAEELKEYLYVETPVELALRRELNASREKRIVFLCGSSGDGKSEIFRRIFDEFCTDFDFHLDATHSFDPNKDAVQTLDDRFSEYDSGSRPLVVGINIGMLANYASAGDDAHTSLKRTILGFLRDGRSTSAEYVFINFEEYPRFELVGDSVDAPFIRSLLSRLCEDCDENPIARSAKTGSQSSPLHLNFRLLSIPEIQERICMLLFYVYLRFDQFLTARTILDFIHQILTGPGNLCDNLFCRHGSDLANSLAKLDPSHTRSLSLDLFQVKASLQLYEPAFDEFRHDVFKSYGLKIKDPRSWVRLFYVMQNVDFSNNYHHRFRDDLRRRLFDEYRSVWQLHRDFAGKKELRKSLRAFYSNTFIEALESFANRFAPELDSGQILLEKSNGYALSARAHIQPSLSRIGDSRPKHLKSFDVHLTVNENDVDSVPVSVSFLELARRITRGYRPNTHDKTSVVVLEELVDHIRRRVRHSDQLDIQRGTMKWTLQNKLDDDEILVEH